MTKTTKSRLMTIANKLVGKGYNRRTAMLKAWVIAKAERLSVRISRDFIQPPSERSQGYGEQACCAETQARKHQRRRPQRREPVGVPRGCKGLLPNWLSAESCRLCYSPSAGQGRNSQP